ncbi:hypothetical protein MTR_8g005165 [Medicago truncatula]|uniref:Uncharacterized protein n=1 Tax=Medicago truncatula TaxID=3880 RepID=A0A072TK09_MEDTR|nr:hypothetical protein MTR_8g005165 [Medicago truncatula]
MNFQKQFPFIYKNISAHPKHKNKRSLEMHMYLTILHCTWSCNSNGSKTKDRLLPRRFNLRVCRNIEVANECLDSADLYALTKDCSFSYAIRCYPNALSNVVVSNPIPSSLTSYHTSTATSSSLQPLLIYHMR